MPIAEANAVLRWAFNDTANLRMETLQDINSRGEMSEAERGEFETYATVGQIIAILQTKARLALRDCFR